MFGFKKKKRIIITAGQAPKSVEKIGDSEIGSDTISVRCEVRLDQAMSMMLAGLIEVSERFHKVYNNQVDPADGLAIRFCEVILKHSIAINNEMSAQAKEFFELEKKKEKDEGESV